MREDGRIRIDKPDKPINVQQPAMPFANFKVFFCGDKKSQMFLVDFFPSFYLIFPISLLSFSIKISK